MRLSDLLGAMVVTEAGWPLGHVVDLRAEEHGNRVALTHLLVGRQAFAQRLFGTRSAEGGRATAPHEAVPWDAVVDVEPGRKVIVKEGTEPRRRDELA
jgi:sporulation protein YlmC with PRC-barrel domain